MVFTGAQLITRALFDIRVLGIGRALNDAQATIALPYLQEIIDSFKIERLAMYQVSFSPFTLVANQASRTIGPTGQFVFSPVPRFLASASVKPVGQTLEQPVDIWPRTRYLAWHDKAATDLLPRAIYMEPGAVNNTIYFVPVPTTAATLMVGIPVGVEGFADLGTSYTFPEGYHEVFRTELAYRLCRPFAKPITGDLLDDRKKAFGRIQRMNDDGPPIMDTDPAVGGYGYYDIETDDHL